MAEIIQIRANLDEIAQRENKLRKAIHFFTVERNREVRFALLHSCAPFCILSMCAEIRYAPS